MARRERGLYELLVTEALASDLDELGEDHVPERGALRAADAADRLALHLSHAIQRAIAAVEDDKRVEDGVALVRSLLEIIDRSSPKAGIGLDRPREPGEVLRALLNRRPDGQPETIPQPLIPLLDTTLLTNAPDEPRVGHQISTEIQSADRIDVVMAFIRWSGIRPLLEALRLHCAAGRELRVLTTTYTNSTEARALDGLAALGAKVRVSYDATSTRLHAKAWLFHRCSGFTTAYVGSSNLTYSAQVTGLEWNMRISAARNPDVIDKFAAVFETYWNLPDFVPYDREQFLARTAADRRDRAAILLPPTELRPEPFQERLLEQIALSRQRGHHRNLLVSATGTGKTVMAALDYARLRAKLPRARLLFVAHREEILTQSRATFCQALRDPSFGELWVKGHRPSAFEHVFASIQSLNATKLEHLGPTHFDVVIVDEFHHAAAASYRKLLAHVQPAELLGLTATPERSDGLPILGWFEGRIAAELRLWDAIEQHRLSPFIYHGIHDGLDLRHVPWRRGVGYDVEGLSALLTGNDVWARFVLEALAERVDDVDRMRALGFCVSVEHARFMARVFSTAGIPATAIWADTPDEERHRALADLAAGRVRVIFSVDLFNEGIDVPTVDTLLMLRPTESPTLFLQQLGRGLRRSQDKTVCTVLDFVGHHCAEFRFDRRFRALLGGSRRELEEQVEAGFPFLPAGCHMELDRVATEIVLASIRNAIPSQWKAKVDELKLLASGAAKCSLPRYLEATGLGLEDVYANDKSWSDMCADAGLAVHPPGIHEERFRRACGRLLHVDDMVRLEVYQRLLASERRPALESLSVADRRLLRMLVASVVDRTVTKGTTLEEGCALLWNHPQVRVELLELLDVLADRLEHVTHPLDHMFDVPLQIHARYTRIEILAGFGIGDGARLASWQKGVRWAKDAKADLLAFTLDKTSGQFSPTTRYRNYAVSRDLIHWESQSKTRANDPTGLRYQHHARLGTSIMLFARLRADQRAFHFLGPATYVGHERERPMAITWRLEHPLPGDLFAAFAAAVA